MTTDKPKSPRRKPVKFTREVKDFILDKMKSGMTLLEVCKKHKSEVPAYEAILTKGLKDHEFNLELNDAYGIMLMRKMDILQETASIPPSQLYPELDWKEASETKRSIVDVQKFLLGKLAPVLSSRFQKQEKIEVTGIDTGPKITVLKYYLNDDNLSAGTHNIINQVPQLLDTSLDTSCSQTLSTRELDSYTVNTEE